MKRSRKRFSSRSPARKSPRSRVRSRGEAASTRKKRAVHGKMTVGKKRAQKRAKASGTIRKRRAVVASGAKPAAGRVHAPRIARLSAGSMATALTSAGVPGQTLLIPGTQATCLEDAGGTVVYNAVRVSLGLDRDSLGGRPPEQWIRLLSMRHDPGRLDPVATSLEPGTRLSTGKVVHTPYNRLETFVHDFPYDWRGDLRFSAARLLQYLSDHRPANGGRWNLIGHSQGGLLIVLASKLTASPEDFSRLVARIVLVGAPLAGTMQATRALLTGRDDLGPGMQQAARDIGRTWPSLYQMLPSWSAVLDENGHAVPGEQQLTQPGGWPNQVGIQEDLLLRARQTQALLTGPFAHVGPGTATLAIFGEKQDTPVTIVRDAGGLQPATMRNEAGDSLVPCERTLQWGGSPFANHSVVFDGNVNPHAMLCEDEDVVSEIQRFLAAPAPPAPVP